MGVGAMRTGAILVGPGPAATGLGTAGATTTTSSGTLSPILDDASKDFTCSGMLVSGAPSSPSSKATTLAKPTGKTLELLAEARRLLEPVVDDAEGDESSEEPEE